MGKGGKHEPPKKWGVYDPKGTWVGFGSKKSAKGVAKQVKGAKVTKPSLLSRLFGK